MDSYLIYKVNLFLIKYLIILLNKSKLFMHKTLLLLLNITNKIDFKK